MSNLTEAKGSFQSDSFRISKSHIETLLEQSAWAWDIRLSLYLDWCIAGLEALKDGSR